VGSNIDEGCSIVRQHAGPFVDFFLGLIHKHTVSVNFEAEIFDVLCNEFGTINTIIKRFHVVACIPIIAKYKGKSTVAVIVERG